MMLDGEEADQHHGGERDDVGRDHGRGDLQALDGAQHGDGRGDHRVAKEQRRPGEPDDQQRALPPPGGGQGEREQGHGAALTVVVGPHDKDDVFERDDQNDGPEHQRQDTEHGGLHRRSACRAQRLPKRVDRTGSDVAEHHPERAEHQRRPRRVRSGGGGGRGGNRRGH
jgi:hypothetical protein